MRRLPRNFCLTAAAWLAIGAVAAHAQLVVEPPAGEPAPTVDRAEPVDPAVRAVLALRATTPAEQLRSVLLLVDLRAAELARSRLTQLLESELSQSEMVSLVERFGPASLMRLARTESLAPEGRALTDALLEAASRAARDPERLSALVTRLGDPSAQVRGSAISDLAGVGVEGAVVCLAALADPEQTALEANLRAALVAMGRTARGPLLGVLLTTNNDRLKARVIDVIAAQGANDMASLLIGPALTSNGESGAAGKRALLQLIGRVPTPAEAGALIEREVRGHLSGNRPLAADYEDRVELWHWDDATGTCAPNTYQATDASLFIAARLSQDLAALRLENPAHGRLYLICLLEETKISMGMDQPLPRGAGSAYSLAVGMGAGVLSDVLAEALDESHFGAALGAVEVLGDIGDASLLDGQSGRPGPLVRAAGHGDRRLRFAATAAIVKLGRSRPYAGSSRVTDNLAYFAATGGTQRVLIGNPRIGEGQNLAGVLATMNIDAEIASGGKAVIRAAIASADVEMVLLDMTIDRPGVREVVYQLRRDSRTARLPICLLAPAGSFATARKLADRDALMTAFSSPHDDAAVSAMIDRLAHLAGRSRLSPAERQQQAVQALAWFAELAAGPQAFYELSGRAAVVEEALYVPNLTAHAARALAVVGRSSSQRALADLASQALVAVENRQVAAAAFHTNVQRHGVLLTTDEILRQYDRYNASESAGRPTQEVLASILDSIEGKSETSGAGSENP